MAFDSATSPLLRRRSSIAAGHSASVSESSTDSRHDNPFHYTTGKRRLRRRKIRKQLLAALTLILLVALAGLFFRPRRSDEWASAVPYATIFSNTEPQGLPEGHRVVWATQTNATEEAMFPAPYEKYRFNFLHGVVRSNEETYKNPDFPTSHYVHILSLIDHIPLEDIPFIMWQTYQASNLEDVIQEVSCVFSFGGTHSVTKAIRQAHRTYPYPQVQMASLIYCPISEDFQTMLDQKAEQAAVHNSFDSSSFFSRAPEPMYIHLTLQFSLHNTPHTLIHDIKLFPNIIANQPPKNSMAMCIAPLFDPNENSVDLSLQWREHHRMLGVNTVHWYGRSPDWEARIQHYNKLQGTKDTFRLANRISPEARGGGVLQVNGEYADQVLYMMDCMLRALTDHPTEWLAFSDIDEFWLPWPLSPEGFANYLSWRDETVGGVCHDRSHVSGEPLDLENFQTSTATAGGVRKQHKPTTLDLKLASFDHIRLPRPGDGWDNYKCIYRPEKVEMAIVHEPVSYFDQSLQTTRDNPDLSLIHMGSHKAFGTGPWPDLFKPDSGYIEHIKALARNRDKLKKKLSDPLPQPEDQ